MILTWASEAREDLLDCWVYIAADKPNAADRAEEAVLDAVRMLQTFPYMGRPGRVEGTRELIVRTTPFIVIYEVAEPVVTILRVWHESRELPA